MKERTLNFLVDYQNILMNEIHYVNDFNSLSKELELKIKIDLKDYLKSSKKGRMEIE